MPSVFRYYLLTLLPLLALDQATKVWVRDRLEVGDAIMVIEGSFRIWYRTNTGAAWSMLGDQWWGIWVLSLIAFGASIAMGVGAWRLPKGERVTAACLGALTSGALGNMIDRLLYRRVTDFLDVYAESGPIQAFFKLIARSNHYPTFNVADIAIVGGAIVIGLLSFKKPEAAVAPTPPM